MRESAIEGKVCHDAEAEGWFQRKLSWIGRTGAPDRFFAKEGRVVLIEFKAPGEVPRADQVREHKRLRAAGVEVHVVDNVADGHRVLGLVAGLV